MSSLRWHLATLVALLFGISAVSQGCIPIPSGKMYKRDPILRAYMPHIVKGQTTRTEIERQLGRPDVEVDGTHVTIHPNTPLDRYFTSWKAAPGWTRGFAYSSIDQDHVALLYYELEVDQLTIATLTPVSGAGFRLTAFRNMLLVLLRKDTGVVDEVAYRQEFAR